MFLNNKKFCSTPFIKLIMPNSFFQEVFSLDEIITGNSIFLRILILGQIIFLESI